MNPYETMKAAYEDHGKNFQKKWTTAVLKARKALGVKGFQAVKKGTPLYKKAKEIYGKKRTTAVKKGKPKSMKAMHPKTMNAAYEDHGHHGKKWTMAVQNCPTELGTGLLFDNEPGPAPLPDVETPAESIVVDQEAWARSTTRSRSRSRSPGGRPTRLSATVPTTPASSNLLMTLRMICTPHDERHLVSAENLPDGWAAEVPPEEEETPSQSSFPTPPPEARSGQSDVVRALWPFTGQSRPCGIFSFFGGSGGRGSRS
jgi:hypothetical protein